MNNLMEVIYQRRAVKKYKDTTVEKRIIDQIIDAGRMAPSAMNLQPWKFYVVTDREFIHQMDDQIKLVAQDIYRIPQMVEFFKAKSPIFHGAPVVIFITAPKANEGAALDVGMCAQNIMLSAKVLGLDTCPIGFGKFIELTSLYSQLEIAPTDQVLISLTVGYADEEPFAHERKKQNVFYIKTGIGV